MRMIIGLARPTYVGTESNPCVGASGHHPKRISPRAPRPVKSVGKERTDAGTPFVPLLPWKEWYKGRARIRAFFAYAFDWAWSSRADAFRMVPTRANAEVAFGTYVRRPGESNYHPHALQGVTINEGQVVRLVVFVGSRFFPAFGLPSELGSQAKVTPRGSLSA